MKTPRIPERGAVAALALVALLAPACSQAGEVAEGPKPGELKKREAARVRVATVVRREMVRTLDTTTVVESENEVQVYPRASGIVVEVIAEEGDAVEAGAVLAVLDQREANAMVADAKVAVSEAQDAIRRAEIAQKEAESRIHPTKLAWDQASRDYERNEKAGLISQQALDTLRTARDTRESEHQNARLAHERSIIEVEAARTSLEKARLALERAELSFSYTQIEAPIAGIVAQRGVRVGGTVGRGTSVIETAGAAYTITDPSKLRSLIYRPQRELGWFVDAAADGPANGGGSPHPAIEIRARAEALPGQVFRGRIDRVAPSIDPQSGAFRVVIALDAEALPPVVGEGAPPAPAPAALADGSLALPSRAARLLPGMLVRLEIVTDRHPDALVVPKRALRREGEVDLVFVVRDGRALRVEVEEGYADDADVEVRPREPDALVAGDQVVIVGNRDLEDGGEVELEEPAGRPAGGGADATKTDGEPRASDG